MRSVYPKTHLLHRLLGHDFRLAIRHDLVHELLFGRKATEEYIEQAKKKLKVTLADGGTRYDYVDVKSRQVVRSDKTETIRGRTVQMEETYADFREVGGLFFPYFIETHVTDRPEVITIVVETVELNPDLDDSRFRMPE